MQLLKNRFLFAPFLLLCVLFGLDKLFWIETVRQQTQLWNKIEPAIYESRLSLFRQLQDHYPKLRNNKQKLGVILGTSRAGEFDSKHFARFVPDSQTYNFSAPLAGPAYHDYWLEQLLGAGIKPDFVIVEADPVLFSPASMRYPLAYSFDFAFVWQYLDFRRAKPPNPSDFKSVWNTRGSGFTFDEAETFWLKQTFALYKYPPNLKAYKKNRTVVNPFTGMTGHGARGHFASLIANANEQNLGGIPNVLLETRSEAEIASKAIEDARVHLYNYAASHTQTIFFKKLLSQLAQQGIRTIVYWPLAPRPYRAIMEELGLVADMQAMIRKELSHLEAQHPQARLYFVDPNGAAEIRCRHFRDSHHLSGRCYDQLTDYLLKTARVSR